MLYRFLADFTLIFHLCYVLFAVFGGLLVLRRRSLIWLHLPALFWGIIVQVFSLTCPLTEFENKFRALGGESGYTEGFVEHYLTNILYFHIDYRFHFALGFILLLINLLIYSYIFVRWRKMK